ncbi:MAG TPA: radical SAM protein [Candidatus Omnitrophota bacterium]|nr:radical SAM protein [Candidatus Omnitrophota bacterium]
MTKVNEQKITTNPFYHYQDLWKSENFKKWEAEQSDEFKKYRRLWQECPRLRKAPPAPISINLELTDVCNAGNKPCIMCPKWFLKPHNQFMAYEDAVRVLDEARSLGVYAVNLNGAGESLLHKDFPKIVQYARKIGFLDVMVHTNGTMLTREMSEKLIDAGLTRLIVSVDSHIPEIYQTIRPNFKFSTVYQNVKNFIAVRDQKGKREPILRLTMVVMKHNVDTIKDTIKFWSFADYITINDCMYFDDFKVFDFDKQKINSEAKQKGLIYACAPLYQQLTVTIDFKIISCSTIYAKNYKILGHYGKQSLKEAWEGRELAEMRKAHESGRCTDIPCCEKCDLPQIELLKKIREQDGVMLR